MVGGRGAAENSDFGQGNLFAKGTGTQAGLVPIGTW